MPQVGGKAVGLGSLLRAGQPVPASFVVTAARVPRATCATDRAGCPRRPLARVDAPVPTRALRAARDRRGRRGPLQRHRRGLDRGELRRPVPDLPRRAGAGDVLARSSSAGRPALDPHVGAYRAAAQIDVADAGVAVVVQELVHARAAGVMFTQHPAPATGRSSSSSRATGSARRSSAGRSCRICSRSTRSPASVHERVSAASTPSTGCSPVAAACTAVPVEPVRQQDWSISDGRGHGAGRHGRRSRGQARPRARHRVGHRYRREHGTARKQLFALQVRPITVCRAAAARRPGGTGTRSTTSSGRLSAAAAGAAVDADASRDALDRYRSHRRGRHRRCGGERRRRGLPGPGSPSSTGRIGAFRVVDEQGARSRAKQLDDAIAGPLQGLVVGIKDVIDTADLPTGYGSPLFADHQPAADADVVAALRRAGAIVLGKTESTEFAMFQPTRTRNPVDLGPDPGRFLERLGGGRGGRNGPGRARHPDGRVGGPARGLLRRLRVQAVLGLDLDDGASGVSPSPWTPSGSSPGAWPTSCSPTGCSATGTPPAAGSAGPPYPPGKPTVAVLSGARVGRLRRRRPGRARPRWLTGWRTTAGGCAEMAMPPAWRHLPGQQDGGHGGRGGEEPACDARRTGRPDLRERPGHRRNGALAAWPASTSPPWRPGTRRCARSCRSRAVTDLVLAPSALGVAPAGLEFTGDPVMCRPWTLLGLPAANMPAWRRPDGLPIGVQLIGTGRDDVNYLTTWPWSRPHSLTRRTEHELRLRQCLPRGADSLRRARGRGGSHPEFGRRG